MPRQHGEPVRADLVGGVAVRRDPVGAGDDEIDLVRAPSGTLLRRRRSPRAGCRAARAPTPSAARPAAAAASRRPSTCCDAARLPRSSHRADRSAVATRRQPAGVAMGEDTRACSGNSSQGVGAHAPAALDLVLVDRARPLGGRVRAHLVERPAQVDRRRPGAGERPRRPRRRPRPAPPRAPARTRPRHRSPEPRAPRASGSPRPPPPPSRSAAPPPRPGGAAGRGRRPRRARDGRCDMARARPASLQDGGHPSPAG